MLAEVVFVNCLLVVVCGPGTYANGMVCSACVAGTYTDTPTNSTSCLVQSCNHMKRDSICFLMCIVAGSLALLGTSMRWMEWTRALRVLLAQLRALQGRRTAVIVAMPFSHQVGDQLSSGTDAFGATLMLEACDLQPALS